MKKRKGILSIAIILTLFPAFGFAAQEEAQLEPPNPFVTKDEKKQESKEAVNSAAENKGNNLQNAGDKSQAQDDMLEDELNKHKEIILKQKEQLDKQQQFIKEQQGRLQQLEQQKQEEEVKKEREPIISPDGKITSKEQQIIDTVKSFGAGTSHFGGYMNGGKLVFVHGSDAGTPTVIAAPLQVTDIELEPGEMINEIVIGDSARWQIDSGKAGLSQHIFVKPIDAGLQTSAVITTNRRVYHLKFLSRQTDFTPYVGFAYQTDMKEQLEEAKRNAARRQEWQTTDSGYDLADLDFGYDVVGQKRSWTPERVYSNGKKMYVQLPPGQPELPALMVRKGERDVLANYRVKDDGRTLEVDGVFPHLALVIGVGRYQELIEIFKHGMSRSSWTNDAILPVTDQEKGR